MGEKVQKIIEEIKSLTVVELNELIKSLEEEFGVSGAVFQAPVQASSAPSEEAAPQKVTVVLVDSGANKINVIKALRTINPNLGLKEAKDIVDNVPQTIKENIDKSEAEKIKEEIEKAGGKVEIK
jgi:large subunit ribosomal protein L7/L12